MLWVVTFESNVHPSVGCDALGIQNADAIECSSPYHTDLPSVAHEDPTLCSRGALTTRPSVSIRASHRISYRHAVVVRFGPTATTVSSGVSSLVWGQRRFSLEGGLERRRTVEGDKRHDDVLRARWRLFQRRC